MNDQDDTKDTALTAPRGAQRVEKKAYIKPAVVEYGDVREFTRGPGGSQPDGRGGSFSS